MKFNIDGTEVEYNAWGSLTWGGTISVPLGHPPTKEEVRAVLLGWKHGYEDGKRDGRSILQNDFRNLMGLQK